MNRSVMSVICYERGGLLWTGLLWSGLFWSSLLWTWFVMNGSVINRSVMNVVCFKWSVVSSLLWAGLFWTDTDLASRDYIFHRNAFYVLFQKFRFRAVIFKLGFVCLFPSGYKSPDEYIHNILPCFIFCTLNHFLA